MRILSTGDDLIAREENLTTVQSGNFGLGLQAKQRSTVVGGYLALCLAGDNQSGIDKVILFCGEDHRDMLGQHLDHFARHPNAAYLVKRSRRYLLARSYLK